MQYAFLSNIIIITVCQLSYQKLVHNLVRLYNGQGITLLESLNSRGETSLPLMKLTTWKVRRSQQLVIIKIVMQPGQHARYAEAEADACAENFVHNLHWLSLSLLCLFLKLGSPDKNSCRAKLADVSPQENHMLKIGVAGNKRQL